MIILYILLAIMLLIALSLLAIPFLNNASANKLKIFSCLAGFLIILSVWIYYLSTNTDALYNWFSTGKQHYQLLNQFEQLGGINGAITQIKKRLAANPEDAQGWLILGKLYLSQQNIVEAKKALTKAHSFSPKDEQINQLYQLVMRPADAK